MSHLELPSNITGIPICPKARHSVISYKAALNDTSNLTSHSSRALGSENEIDWFGVIVPAICLLGIIGNVLNVLVLTRRRMLSGMDRLEKSANYGLVALAVSDLMFCLMVFPLTFIKQGMTVSSGEVYGMYYRVYGTSTINLFLMISTWLIVCMAVNRFIVVVYPFKARQVLGTRYTLGSILFVYIFSLTAMMPFYLRKKIGQCQDDYGELKFAILSRWNDKATDDLKVYIQWVWPIIADFVPVVVLALCNTRLILELRAADTTRRRLGQNQGQASRDSSQKVTLTLVVIVLMLLFLASPAEILRYINPYKVLGPIGDTVASVVNIMQLFNFALNFVLYCLVNPGFRKEIKAMFACCLPKSKHNRFLVNATECTNV